MGLLRPSIPVQPVSPKNQSTKAPAGSDRGLWRLWHWLFRCHYVLVAYSTKSVPRRMSKAPNGSWLVDAGAGWVALDWLKQRHEIHALTYTGDTPDGQADKPVA